MSKHINRRFLAAIPNSRPYTGHRRTAKKEHEVLNT